MGSIVFVLILQAIVAAIILSVIIFKLVKLLLRSKSATGKNDDRSE